MVKRGIWLLGLVTLCFFGCDKVGGGETTKVCFLTKHHEEVIPNITIYVKYRADDFPGYDPDLRFDAVWESDSQGRICMERLPLGHHWFVAIGYDEKIREQVIGSVDLLFDLRNLQYDQILYVGEE